MSSFTICKEQYIKAAGVVAGLAETVAGRDPLWIYDYETRRNSTPEDYYRMFNRMFEYNAVSVGEQYKEDPELETEEYKDVFESWRRFAARLQWEPDKQKQVLRELSQFFDSAIYQTEKDEYMFNMMFFFNRIIAELYKAIYAKNDDCKSWEELNLDDIKPEHNYQRIY